MSSPNYLEQACTCTTTDSRGCSGSDCCSGTSLARHNAIDTWITNTITVAGHTIPTISTQLVLKDYIGTCKVRCGIGRMKYKIAPGLYAVGNPIPASPVLVSANYKLTFDTLRKELSWIDCWLLILDTDGINVWCSAGKGTFSSNGIIDLIKKTALPEIVTHRTIILPQLGAPGVSAHEVAKKTGFSVVYGPVRAKDIRPFLASGLNASQSMRTVKFTLWDRFVLTPVELILALKISMKVFGILFLCNLFAVRPFGVKDFIAYLGAVAVGAAVTPLLLPFLPGRSFAWKGWLLGICWAGGILSYFGWFDSGYRLLATGYMLTLPAVSSYFALNFTGSTTYTSFSGVIKEMKTAIPLIVLALIAGAILLLTKAFAG